MSGVWIRYFSLMGDFILCQPIVNQCFRNRITNMSVNSPRFGTLIHSAIVRTIWFKPSGNNCAVPWAKHMRSAVNQIGHVSFGRDPIVLVVMLLNKTNHLLASIFEAPLSPLRIAAIGWAIFWGSIFKFLTAFCTVSFGPFRVSLIVYNGSARRRTIIMWGYILWRPNELLFTGWVFTMK